jgi:hypothetical protein
MEMTSFPLYDTLLGLASEKENDSPKNDEQNGNTSQGKNFNLIDISSKINKLNDDQHEVIAALIHHYNINDNNGKNKNGTKIKKSTIPYGGKTINDSKIGILFNFELLPELLQKIICYYVISI